MEIYEKALALWQSYNLQTVADIEAHLHNFRMLFAYHSGRIENPEIQYHDTREIFENGSVAGFTGNPRTLFEQQNQKLCYEYLKEKIAAKEPLTLELIREVHRILTAGTYDERRYVDKGERPGEFKRHNYVTGIHEVGVTPEAVEVKLTMLLNEINSYRGSDILKAGAYFHAVFEYTHPFADGNGRVGRTLLNYFLMTHGHPPLIVHEEDKAGYYHALQLYDEKEELDTLHSFLREQTEKTWNRAIELSEGSMPERKGMQEQGLC